MLQIGFDDQFHKAPPYLIKEGLHADDALGNRAFVELHIKGRRHQCFGVWLDRLVENSFSRALFDDLAVLHDNDMVRERPDHLQIVADE